MQRSDIDRIAEVIAVELARQAGDEVAFQPRIFDGITREGTAETVYLRQAGELVAVLKSHGFGHVPTALHQAADALERQPKTEEWLYAADVIRARADRAGGAA